MKNKLYYRFTASTLLLLLVILGYLVRFFPNTVLKFDRPIQTFVFTNRTDALTGFFKTITQIGNPLNVVALVVVIVSIFLLKKWYSEAIYLGGLFVLISGIIAPLLKLLYQRPRPELANRLIVEKGYSFPSGHATVSMLVFLTLIFILVPRIKNTFFKWILAIFLASLILIIGFSRVYLGVHYPTDILGGYFLASSAVIFAYPYFDKQKFTWRFKGVQK